MTDPEKKVLEAFERLIKELKTYPPQGWVRRQAAEDIVIVRAYLTGGEIK